jgi:hypothetical protein
MQIPCFLGLLARIAAALIVIKGASAHFGTQVCQSKHQPHMTAIIGTDALEWNDFNMAGGFIPDMADSVGDVAIERETSSMKIRTKLVGVAALVLALGVGTYAIKTHAQNRPGFGPFAMHGMGPGMMGMMGPGMMGMALDERTQGQLQVIHTLFVNHDRITRKVENLPNGIRTVTESDDAALAGLIKQHVADMATRVTAGDDPGLPIESDSVHAIFRGKDKIKTSYETTAKGIAVVQTSDDAQTVAALQQHASEVSDFVQEGMTALHTAMMKKMGGFSGGAMPGPMMMMRGMMHGGEI